MRWTLVMVTAGLLVTACKKKPAVENPLSDPVTSTSTDTTGDTTTGDSSDGVAGAEPVEVPIPIPSSRPGASKKPLHKRVNSLVELLQGEDVAKHRQALDGLEQLQRDNPDSGVIKLNIGVAQQKLGNLSAAKSAYRDAKAADASLGHAYLYLGMMEENLGNKSAAEDLYREGIAADYDNVDVRVGLVSLLRKQGKLDEAISEAQKALKVNSLSTEIYNDVGLAYIEQGDLLLAKFMFRKALALPGGEERAYLQANLGRTYYVEGKLPEATIRLKRAVELDPNYVPALVYLSRVYMKDRNYADTVDLLERAAKQAPENHGVQMNLGVAYRGVERYEDSKRAYQRALELDPRNADPHFNLGILHGDYLKDYDAATAAFNDYKSSGGADIALADQYIEDVAREKKRVDRRKKQQAAAKKRDAERAEQKRLAVDEENRLEKEKKAEEDRLKKEEEDRLAAERAAAEAAAQPETPAPQDPAPEDPAPEDPDAADPAAEDPVTPAPDDGAPSDPETTPQPGPVPEPNEGDGP